MAQAAAEDELSDEIEDEMDSQTSGSDQTEPMVDGRRNVQEVLQLVKRSSFTEAETILSSRPDIDMSRTDNLGKTGLHYAASAGHLEMTTLLLERNAPINLPDKAGQTALHYAAVRGKDDVILELVRHGARVNCPDMVKGRTALHFAAFKNRLDTIKLLLFCGADASLLDKEGKSPGDLSKSGDVKKVLDKARACAPGGSSSKMVLGFVTLDSPEWNDVQRLGLSVKPVDLPDDRPVDMMCRKVPVEQSDVHVDIKEEEEIFSDVFSFRFTTEVSEGMTSTVTLPIFNAPGITEELWAKFAGTNLELPVADITKEGHRWKGSITGDLRSFTSLYVVCRPKKETFEVGKDATKVSSAVEKGLELDIPAETFQSPVKLSISVLEAPSAEVMETEHLDDVISVSSFYSLDAGGQTPGKSIHVTVPVPTTYSGTGNLVILSMDDDADEETEQSWKILDTEALVEGNRLSFDISTFSVKVATETYTLKNAIDKIKLKREVSGLFRKSRRREYPVSFLSMTKRELETDTFKVVLECCLSDQLTSRMTHWTAEGYDDQRPSQTGTCMMRTKQRLRVGVTDSIKMMGNSKCIPLEFHSRRENHLAFDVKIEEKARVGIGHVEIALLELIKGQDGDLPLEEEPGHLVASIPLRLERLNTSKKKEKSAKTEQSPMETKTTQNDFFNDDLLDGVFDQIEEPDLYRVFLFMGVTFRDLDVKLSETGNWRAKVKQLSTTWRDAHRTEVHRGLPVLFSALFKAGHRHTAAGIQIRLRDWYTAASGNSTFYDWVTNAYMDSNVLVPATYARPMSDPFFVLLADDIEPSEKLGVALEIPEGDVRMVFVSCLYSTDVLKVLKLLTMFRDRTEDVVRALHHLIVTLDRFQLEIAMRNTILCTKAWLNRYKRKDKLRQDLQTLMEMFDR